MFSGFIKKKITVHNFFGNRNNYDQKDIFSVLCSFFRRLQTLSKKIYLGYLNIIFLLLFYRRQLESGQTTNRRQIDLDGEYMVQHQFRP